jgi:hypothetical protein
MERHHHLYATGHYFCAVGSTIEMKLILAILALGATGCETYQKSKFTPDGFNYTLAVDHQDLNVSQHWFGLTWNLKPGK